MERPFSPRHEMKSGAFPQAEQLNTKIAILQTTSVEAIFANITTGSLTAVEARTLVTTCLCHDAQIVVLAAVEQLCSLRRPEGAFLSGLFSNRALADDATPDTLGRFINPGTGTAETLWRERTDLLLTSLSSTGQKHAAFLVRGIVHAFRDDVLAGASPPQWAQHPLSKALLADVSAQAALVPETARLLATLPRCTASNQKSLLRGLRPFLSFALLEPDAKGERTCFAATLVSELLDLSLAAGPPRDFLLGFLCGHLEFADIQSSAKRTWVLGALKRLLAATLAVEDEKTEAWLRDIAAVAVSFCVQLQRGCGLVCDQGLQTLRCIARGHSQIVCSHLLTLAGLALDSDDGKLYFEVMAMAMAQNSGEAAQLSDGNAATKGLLMQPLVKSLALGGLQQQRAWAGHALNSLRSAGPLQLPGWAGARKQATLEEIASAILSGFQGRGRAAAATAWLSTTRSLLEGKRVHNPGVGKDGALSSPLSMLLGALLQHSSLSVQRQALGTLLAASRAFPLMGPTFLPILVHWLQASTAASQIGDEKEASAMQLVFLEAIPQLATHPACAPLCLRFLQPLAAAESAEVLQAVALRLSTLLWLTSRRSFGRLQAALLGFAAPATKPGPLLRAARASCVRSVCQEDPARATELVVAIQEMLADKSEAVASVALECVRLLCEADTLDFYGAWPVVLAALPGLPRERLQVARRWVALLAHGALDAKALPEQARAVLELLWHAAGDESPEIRAEAYKALSSFTFSDLELLEALRPLQAHARLLLDEIDESARQQCIPLVENALEFEHSIRRRHIAGKGRPAVTSQSSAATTLMRQLTWQIPKQLLSDSTSMGVKLLLWTAPKVGHQVETAPAEAYRCLARRVISAPFGGALGGHHTMLIHSWRSFLNRWLAVEAAAETQESAPPPQRLLQQLMYSAGEDPGAAGNALLAAAALCSLQWEQGGSLADKLMPLLLARLASESSTASLTAAALSVGLAAASLHPADLQGRLNAADRLLDILDDDGRAEGVRAAAAEALGIFVAETSARMQGEELLESGLSRGHLVRKVVRHLMGCVAAAAPGLFGGLEQALEGLGHQAAASDTPNATVSASGKKTSEPVLLGLCTGAAHAMATAARLRSAAVTSLASALQGLDLGPHPPGALQGLCLLLPSLVDAIRLLGRDDELGGARDGCVELLAGLLQGSSHGAIRGAAASALGQIAAQEGDATELQQRWLPMLAAPLAIAQKLPGSSRLVGGVACGLAGLLGGAGLLPGVRPALFDAEQQPSAEALTAVTKALEAVAGSAAFVHAKDQTQWALAAVCAARRRRPEAQGAPRGEPLAPGLVGVPEGAMRELASFILSTSQSREGVQANGEKLRCAVECLAGAPRLPVLPWGRVCRDLTAQANQLSHKGLQQAAIQLAVTHSQLPSSGLSEFLDELTQQESLQALPSALQSLLLEQLSSVLPALSAARRSSLLEIVADLPHFASQEVVAAAWSGLQECCSLSGGDGLSRADLLTAAGHLFAALPPPPELLLGEELRSGGAERRPREREDRLLWASALACLAALTQDERLALVEEKAAGTAAGAFSRIWLVRHDALPPEHLEKSRNMCVEAAPEVGDQLILQMAFTASRLSVTRQHQMLLVTLDAIHVCTQPLQALKTAAAVAAAAVFQDCPADALVASFSVDTAVSVLPYTLSSLLRQKAWQQVCGQILDRVVKLLNSPFRSTASGCLREARDLLPLAHLHCLAQAAEGT